MRDQDGFFLPLSDVQSAIGSEAMVFFEHVASRLSAKAQEVELARVAQLCSLLNTHTEQTRAFGRLQRDLAQRQRERLHEDQDDMEQHRQQRLRAERQVHSAMMEFFGCMLQSQAEMLRAGAMPTS
jgi:hypothetical protein